MHFRHPSYPSIPALLEKRGFWVLKKINKEEAELMPDQNSTGDKVQFCGNKTPSCSKPHQGLFLKQYGAGLSQGELFFYVLRGLLM